MSESFFKAKLGDHVYELPKLTLAETVVLKKKFGLSDLDDFSPTDPEVLLGLLFLCVRREKPLVSDDVILAEVGSIDVMDMVEVEDEPGEAEDPTPAVVASSRKSAAKPKVAAGK